MSCPPLIERELRVALRKNRPMHHRFVRAVPCVLGTILCLVFARVTPGVGVGNVLHLMLCLVGVYVVLRVPALVAGVFAEERGNQTLGLLMLSGLSAAEVFVSKAFSAAMVAMTELLALFPLLALPFLVGGVSFDLFLATILTLPVLLIFVLAVTLLASVLSDEEGAATVLAAVLGAAVCGLPPAIYYAHIHLFHGAPSTWWLRLSPAYLPWLIGTGAAVRGDIWGNLGLALAWSGLSLAGAAVALKRLWREQEYGGHSAPWIEAWRQLVHGTANYRRTLAARWLDSNPFAWLAARDRQPVFLAWAVFGGITGVWLLCWTIWRTRWAIVPYILFLAILLNASLRWLIFHAAAKGLADVRRDGSLELLLTTRLQPSDIVRGGIEVVSRQFAPVARCILALEAALLIGGLAARPWTPSTLYVYGAIASLMLWWIWPHARGWHRDGDPIPGLVHSLPVQGWRRALFAMWVGLNTGRPVFAVWRSSGNSSWIWFLNLYNVYNFGVGFKMFATFPTGSSGEILWASLGAAFLMISWLCYLADWPKEDATGDRLIREFRDIACEPLPERDDPAFKQWNPRERFSGAPGFPSKPPWYNKRIF